MEDAPLDVRHQAALDCHWNSYGQIIGVHPCPKWLHRGAVLKGWGGNLAEKRKAYRSSVESSLLEDIRNPEEEAAAKAVLGSERFVDRIKGILNDMKENVNIRRESTQQRRLMSWWSVNDIVNAVEQVYGIPAEKLRRRGNRGCEGRQILLYLAAVHCRGRYTLSAIGEQLGPVTISGLDSARRRMASRIKKEKILQNKVKQIEKIVKTKVKSKAED